MTSNLRPCQVDNRPITVAVCVVIARGFVNKRDPRNVRDRKARAMGLLGNPWSGQPALTANVRCARSRAAVVPGAGHERAYEDHAVEFAQMTQYPPFKTIASEPRYKELMQRIGLPR
jgi:hypothetical protein